MNAVDLIPIYAGERHELVRELAARLERAFDARCRLRPPWFDPETAFDGSRGQYDSTRLLECLLLVPPRAADRVLGVTSVDLFIPVLTYVFGEAQLGGRAAVVSLNRLRPEAYGLPEDEALLLDRLEKEAIHELGHTGGLLHCRDGGCVMHVSTYVEEIDLKSSRFCAPCANALGGTGAARNSSTG